MATFLFDEIIFGPVRSRRLGVSLGVNLLPVDHKFCNFDCLYCECGWTCNEQVKAGDLPDRKQVFQSLDMKLSSMQEENILPDVITFAGNGEPTMHPDFPGIIDDTIKLRDRYCPEASVAVLSNSMGLNKASIVNTLKKTDQAILKLDTAIEKSFQLINRPTNKTHVSEIIDSLSEYGEGLILQSLFFRGTHNGQEVDNTSEIEIQELLKAYRKIKPEKIMIYTFERDTPLNTIHKISKSELEQLGKIFEEEGFIVEISA